MARGAKRARALIASAIGVLALLGTADAQTRRTSTSVERERRAETQRAERLRAQADTARRDIRALDGRYVPPVAGGDILRVIGISAGLRRAGGNRNGECRSGENRNGAIRKRAGLRSVFSVCHSYLAGL